MREESIRETLLERLTAEIGALKAERLVTRLRQAKAGVDVDAQLLMLIDELQELSPKTARAALEALPELDRRACLPHVMLWLDLGIAIAQSSGATALKYFKDSPLVLGVMDQDESRIEALKIGLEIAEEDAHVALEYIRQAPQILSEIPVTHVRSWIDIGIELTESNVVVGLEFIRQIPKLAPVLPKEQVRSWAMVGLKLIVPNSLGKPDYVATMEFLRTSPSILESIPDQDVREKIVSLCFILAEHSPESSITWLAEAPKLLEGLPSMEWRIRLLQYGALLAEKYADVTLEYLRRASELVRLIGDGPDAVSRFEKWFQAGMDVAAYGVDGARAYFSVESQRAMSSVEQALSGVPFREVARWVKLFVQGLCGTDVTVTALPDSLASAARATVSEDGRTISLPALLRRYPTAAENERLYLIMAAHEAGHLEFGTYRLRLESLADLVETIQYRYLPHYGAKPDTLAAFFQMYPNPALVRDLWIVLEDARIEFLLQREYPGLRDDLVRLAGESVTPRDPAQGLTAKELIIDCLLRLSTGEAEDVAVPKAVKEEVATLWAMCRPVLCVTATAEETVRLVDAIYVRLEELLAAHGEMVRTARHEDTKDPQTQEIKTEQIDDQYRAVKELAYRGSMNPEFITWNQDIFDRQQEPPAQSESQKKQHGRNREQESGSGELLREGRSYPSIVEEYLTLKLDAQSVPETVGHEGRAVLYPEWDYRINDYRINWCRVIERPADSGSDEFVTETLAAQQSLVKSLRRFFESLRPPVFRRVTGESDGEELDFDALIRRTGELRAGVENDDRLYIRREKRERDVAVAFLIDISGSTSRNLETGRRVIDIEKESLVLLCEALDAVGDQYGLYAYSGHGREHVEFLTIKDFEDRLGALTAHRVGGLAPRHQNRDGAAIRHVTAKLLAREAKTRLLMLLSDGRPLDDQYKDEYSLEDTKEALREARRRGVETFCVTIDREAENYLRRMYAEAQYCVIGSVEALPTRLPLIYRQLTV